MLFTCAAIALFGILLTFLRYSFWRKSLSQQLPGPKPGFFNVLGNVSDFWNAKDAHQCMLTMMMNHMHEYRKDQLFCAWLLYEPVIVVIRAEAAKELLMDLKINNRSWVYDRMRTVIGSGLITSEGQKWKSRRRLLNPCFNFNILKSFLTSYNEGAQRLVTSLQRETKKDFTFIANPIKLCTLDVMCETIFGVKIMDVKEEFTEYIDALNRVLEIYMTSLFSPWLWPSIIFFNSKIGKEYIRLINVIHQVTRNIIRENKERYLRGETDNSLGKHKALMDLLMQKHLETQELSEEDIREEVDTFTAAGHETTATTIMWALYSIGLYPEVQAKLHKEIDQIFGKDVERHVTDRDLQDLQYLDCVLKESSRLFSTVPVYVRKAIEDTKICGYPIPKGTSCAVFTYFLHRDEEVFPEPEVFKPERFLPENSANIPTCAYSPFSDGPRKCIGYKFAELEMKVVICNVLRNFTIESLDKRHKIKPVMKCTLQPSIPFRIRFRSRFVNKDLETSSTSSRNN